MCYIVKNWDFIKVILVKEKHLFVTNNLISLFMGAMLLPIETLVILEWIGKLSNMLRTLT